MLTWLFTPFFYLQMSCCIYTISLKDTWRCNYGQDDRKTPGDICAESTKTRPVYVQNASGQALLQSCYEGRKGQKAGRYFSGISENLHITALAVNKEE
jgi:hypothetical protein